LWPAIISRLSRVFLVVTCPLSWLKAYLKFKDTNPELLEEFFSKEDLVALNEALFANKEECPPNCVNLK